MNSPCIAITAFFASAIFPHGVLANWKNWWSYQEGIDGPNYWFHNPEWLLCRDGRQQSPIDLKPSELLFDPNLKNLTIESTMVQGLLINTGRDITLEIKSKRYQWLNISGGPLSYHYRVSEIKFHLANRDGNGSEHTIEGHSFPVEMQIIAYNSDLYKNVTEASKSVKGLAIIAVFLEVGNEIHKAFYYITKELKWLYRKGGMAKIKDVSLTRLLPKTTEYMTYDGSLTQPGCYETVTWVIMNKPVRIAREQLTAFRIMFKGSENVPGLPLEINSRHIMPLNNRVVRTNINGTRTASRLCSMQKDMYYRVNSRFFRPRL